MDERKKKRQPIKKSMDENDYMSFDTYQEFLSKRMWKFIYDCVIRHEKFEEILKSFNLHNNQDVKQGTSDKTHIDFGRTLESRQ